MGKQLDGRSDIYAVGVVAYELLTGRLPFPDAQGPAALIAAQLRRTPEAPSRVRGDAVPPGVDAVVLRMLEKDRAKRFNDAADLRQACLSVLGSNGGLPVHASGPQPLQAAPAPAHSSAPQPPQVAPPYVPPDAAASGKMRGGQAAPTTEKALEAASTSRLWIWVVLAGIIVGGAIGAYIALGR
jgi:serine/threonine-protein kinase